MGGKHFNSPALQKPGGGRIPPPLRPPPRKGGVRGTWVPRSLTGMAQRQRARLLTARTLDRNGLPVSFYLLEKMQIPRVKKLIGQVPRSIRARNSVNALTR